MILRILISVLLPALFYQPIYSQSTAVKDSLLNRRMFQAIRSGTLDSLKTQLKSGADPNFVMSNYSVLMAAALNGTYDQMKLLLDHGANPNYCNSDSISAIWLAVDDIEKTKLLLKHGVNLQQRSREGNSVLVKLAAMPGHADLLQLLVNAGCDLRHTGRENNALYNAAASGDTAMLGYFIRAGVPVNDTNCFGDYPINASLNYRSFSTLKMLVENGANVNPIQAHGILPLLSGITPLMWAAISNDKSSFYYLLEHGANAKAISPGGYTTLMCLARSHADDPEMTKALLDRGVDPAVKALDDTDALYHFKKRGNTASIALLETSIQKK